MYTARVRPSLYIIERQALHRSSHLHCFKCTFGALKTSASPSPRGTLVIIWLPARQAHVPYPWNLRPKAFGECLVPCVADQGGRTIGPCVLSGINIVAWIRICDTGTYPYPHIDTSEMVPICQKRWNFVSARIRRYGYVPVCCISKCVSQSFGHVQLWA
jgi:hypothetical protein